MSNVKKIEKEIYNHKRGIGKVEYGSWWNKELYAYLESFRFKKIQQWYNIYLKNKDCLVLGCGNGEDIKDFKEKPKKCIGIDISFRLISEAKIKFKRHEFINCDAEELPFKNESFDVIFAKSILHHLPHFEKSIDEIKRVLKNEGILLMAYEPCLLNPIAAIGRKFFPSNVHTPYEKPFIPYRLKTLFMKKNFQEIEIDYFYLFSIIFPIVGKYINSRKIFKKFIKISISLEKSYLKKLLRELYWIIAGIWKKI